MRDLQEIKQVRQAPERWRLHMNEKPQTCDLVKTMLTGGLFSVRMNIWVLVLHINKNGKQLNLVK